MFSDKKNSSTHHAMAERRPLTREGETRDESATFLRHSLEGNSFPFHFTFFPPHEQ